MSHSEGPGSTKNSWEEIGEAAEEFARRVARDAAKFAERLETHASELARDVSRDWHRGRRHRHHNACHHHSAPSEVREVFEDVRGILGDVLDSVGSFIDRVFPDAGAGATADWTQVVANRAVSCVSCGSSVVVGDNVEARRGSEGMEFRCAACAATGQR